MAPIALSPQLPAQEVPSKAYPEKRDGQHLEALVDDIEEINIMADLQKKVKNGTATEEEKSRVDNKDKDGYRDYTNAKEHVKNLYREQHINQTVAYNLQARIKFRSQTRAEMTIWEAMEKLDTLIDESDPDTDLGQIQHLMQTAEAIREDGWPKWMQLTGLIHDLGKLLNFYGSKGQWDVVGDTFPVGCGFEMDKIILSDSFKENEDFNHPVFSTKYGIYHEGCGLDNVMLSWGHDEYLYQICKEQSTLPDEALAMIRFHSFYPWHRDGAYDWMMDDHDKKMKKHVLDFNQYDLYSKRNDMQSVEQLKKYYMEIIDEYFPQKVIRW